MAKYIDKSLWEEEVLIPDTSTPVLGGQPVWEQEQLVDGFYNIPVAILADRTRYLRNRVEGVEQEVAEGLEGALLAEDNLSDLADVGQAKYNLGLNLVDNVRDTDKPVSTSQRAALDTKVDKETGKGLSSENFTIEEKNQLAQLPTDLGSKVDKQTGYGLSEENYTLDEKNKLASLESSRWKGEFVSLLALQTAYPTGSPGDYADVDGGVGEDVSRYIWDTSDGAWVKQAGEAAPITAAQVKSLYESNPDTNAYTDLDKSKLAGVEAGATNLAIGTTSTTAKAGDWQPETATKTQTLNGTSNVFVSGVSYHNIISWATGSHSTGSITLDLDTSLNHDLTISGAVVMASPSNADVGKTGDIVIRMAATGTVGWNANWKFLGSVPNIGTNGELWVVSYKILSSTEILASAGKHVV